MTPLLFNQNNEPILLENLYKGSCCFLVLSGPSINDLDLTLLQKRHIVTASVNNAGVLVRPNIWFTVDHPKSFCDVLWYDPGILKIVPEENYDKSFYIFDENGKKQSAKTLIHDLPNAFKFRRNKYFNHESFLIEPTVNWGTHGETKDSLGLKGIRSVLLVAIRFLHWFGFRKIFLLGADFNMDVDKPYAFNERKWKGGVASNNRGYVVLQKRLESLQPQFDKDNFKMYNCNPNSNLKLYPYMPYEEAIEFAIRRIPENIITYGMYGDKE